MTDATRILVLGGSTEGFAAAEALVADGFHVISSFAGRTATRRRAAGEERVGGFGGVTGLAAFLAVEDIALVVDALHPFAERMKANAGAACADVGVPLIHIERPQWTQEPGDDWRSARDEAEAATLIPSIVGVCFVTIGRQRMHLFERRTDLDLLFRVIDPPDRPLKHPRAQVLCERGPFTLESERALFDERGITCLVTKNSGSPAAEAKILVARERGIPVVMVDRPPSPGGRSFTSVAAAVAAVPDVLNAVA